MSIDQSQLFAILSISALLIGFFICFYSAKKTYNVGPYTYSNDPIQKGDMVVHKTNKHISFIVRGIGMINAECYRYIGRSSQEYFKGEFPLSELLKIKTK